MERYVVSKDLAERLKAAGFPQTTVHSWFMDYSGHGNDEPKVGVRDYASSVSGERTDTACAPISDELLEQLEGIEFGATVSHGKISGNYGAWLAGLTTFERVMENPSFQEAEKPADALAELYLWCADHGHLPEGGKA